MRLGLFCGGCIVLAASPAVAQRGGGGAPAVDRAVIDSAIEDLKSQDLPTVLRAVTTLADAADPRATEPLTELLRKGPPDDVTHAVIQALGAIADPRSVNILIEYMRHRRARVRRYAVQAIAAIVNPRVRDQVLDALRSALRDSNDRVRGAAANALAEHQDRGAIDLLFLAFERNVVEAAVAIGKLGGAAEAERLAGYLGRRQLSEILPGFDEFLRRPEFPEDAKVEIIRKLESIAGPDVKRFLVSLTTSPPQGFPARVREEAERLIRMIPD